jgi:hypothetical protein
MTVQLSTLAIRPDLDASGFSAGARDMANAQRQIVSGAREVSVAMTDASGKISTAGDPLSRLERRFVSGAREMAEFTRGMRALNAGLETGRYQAESASILYQSMAQKLGVVANAADLTRQGYAQLGAVVDRVNSQMARSQSVGAVSGRLSVNDNMSTFRRQNLMYQAFDIGQTVGPLGVGRTLIQQGPQIAQMYAGQGGINALLKDAGSLAGGFAARLAPIAPLAIAGGAAIHQMQEDIEKATGKSVTFGETFSAAVHVVAGDIRTALAPALETVSPMVAAAWDKITAGALLTGDTIINSFHAAYEDVKFVWSQFPNMIGGLIDGGMNMLIGGVETTLNTVSVYFDAFIRKINSMLDRMSELSGGRFKGHIDEIGTFDLPRVDNTFARDFDAANDAHKDQIRRILSGTPLEDYYKSVRDRISGDVGYGLPTGGSGSPIPIPQFRGIDDNPADQDFMTDFKRQSEMRVRQMQQETTALDLSGKALTAYRFEMEALNAAIAKNIDLNPGQKEAIHQQAEAYAAFAGPASRSTIAVEITFDKETLQ